MECFLKCMADFGIWDIIGILIALIPGLFFLWYLFPQKSMDGLSVARSRDVINQAYPKVVRITLTNTMEDPIYIRSKGFRFEHDILPSPIGANNGAGLYEAKFEGRNNPNILTEFDFLLRHGDPPITTWVPVDPNTTDQEIDTALNQQQVGIFFIKCQRISGRRNKSYSLRLTI